MTSSYRDMAIRQITAETKFVECVMADGFTKDEAHTVADSYVHLGLLRFDAVDGQFYIKHGTLFAADIMRNAITNHTAIKATRARKYGKR